MDYDINKPWLTLDPWQKEYIYETDPNQSCFLLTGRQSGKTTAMSLKAVELCVKHFKKGEFVLINSITEKQAYHMLAKAMVYARTRYPNKIIEKGKDKPTKHKLMFKNGTGILCYAAGETGAGLRGLTIKKLMSDEGSRMSEEYFISVSPMLSVVGGSKDIASTPNGKRHRDGSIKYFYRCSLDEDYKKFYVSAEDCPRHDEEFLEKEKKRMTKLAYAQEYLAMFTDELLRIYDDDLLKKVCKLKRNKFKGEYIALGVDVAGLGNDLCTYEIIAIDDKGIMWQVESITQRRNYTTDTTKKIIELNNKYDLDIIAVDDGGVGFGVFSELMDDDRTKRKTIALNNSSRPIDQDGKRSKFILKEEMYTNLLVQMENKNIFLLDDDEVIASLSSIQHDEGKIFGSNSHITEGIIRAVWVLSKQKNLKLRVYSIKV